MSQTDAIHFKAFPKFDDQQLATIAGIAEPAQFVTGEELVSHGQKDYPFYVIRSGNVKIVERDCDGERPIANHGPREFVGDVDMLTGRSSLFVAVATEPVEAYRLSAGQLRMLLGQCPTVSEMLLEAFQLRRTLLADLPFVGVRVVGTTNTPATTRLREFLYKNHVPYSLFEADTGDGQQQLHRLGADQMELPVVRCNGSTIGNPSLPKLGQDRQSRHR